MRSDRKREGIRSIVVDISRTRSLMGMIGEAKEREERG